MVDTKLLRILNNIAVLLEIKGENPFKSRAYSNAAELIESENIDIGKSVADSTLASIKGFGDALQKKITEYVKTGQITYYENLIKEIPVTLVDVTKINGIGPKKAAMLWEKLGITNLDELEEACISSKLQSIKGFTAKSQEMILNSIHHKKAAKGKHLQSAGQAEATEILKEIEASGLASAVEFSGTVRRFDETWDIIEFVAAGDRKAITDFISVNYEIMRDLENEEEYLDFRSKSDVRYRVYFTDENNFGSVLHETTGNAEYLVAMNKHALTHGLILTEISFSDERLIFEQLKMQYIPPELREDEWAVESAASGTLPQLIERSDLRGMLHVHSNWSDGKHSIKEMALSAKNLGFEYIAICDHSRTAAYANGLDTDRVKQQHDEIDKLNEELVGVTILKGIESDILPDGSLDFPDTVLGTFDLVVASVHSSFNQSRADMTKRIIYALMSPYTDILGHPTGRLLLARQPYEIDIHEVIDAAAEYKKIIEINSNPYRLDLSWRNTIYAKQAGVSIAINPDSHHKDTLNDVDIGIKVARKGRLERHNVVNCLSLPDFIKLIGKKNF